MEREEYLQKCGCDVCRGRLMRCAYGSSFTVGTAVMPRDHYAALQAEKLCRDAPVLGGASNTLPLKEIPLAIVTEHFRGIIPGGAELYVYGGQSLHSVCAFAAAAGLSGIEELCGIPGSIGGAAAGNSGCFGRELSDVLVYADVGSGGRAERVYAKDAGFSYRKSALKEKGIRFFGGENSPYIWMECGMPSWEFFDKLLTCAQVVGTPGAGFGEAGEGYFRLTAFNSRENTTVAAERIKKL